MVQRTSMYMIVMMLLFAFASSSSHASSEFSYEVAIEGVADSKLLRELKAISDAIALKKRPPPSLNLLKRRIERDNQRLLKLLQANGYYGAKIGGEIDSKERPLKIIFQVDLGLPYLLNAVDFQISKQAEEPPVEIPAAEEIGLILRNPFSAKAVLGAQKGLLRAFKSQGYPFSKVAERKIVVDHTTKSVKVAFLIDLGPKARFGRTVFEGIESVDEAFMRHKIPWQEGDQFNADLLSDFQKRLMDLGLFATVRVKTGESLDEKGRLPITIAVTERSHRSVRAGVNYKTDEGLGGRISWEHRNLFQRAEGLRLSATISDIVLSAEGVFRKPDFLRDNQALRINLRVAEDDTDAYFSRNIGSSATIDRKVTKEITVGAGLGFKISRVTQLGVEEDFSLIFLPLYFASDTSNDLLDPSRGGRLGLRLTPYYDVSSVGEDFTKGSARYRHYIQLLRNPSLVFAGGATVRSIVGAERDEIPADERYYAGGGGSIRGYAFQSVGPRVTGVPVGGRSLIELALEFRLKISDRFGLVAFLDGGNAFTTSYPDLGEELFWGAGGGFRYYTPIGPFRLDIGFPLDRRPGVDDSFQIYISLGQAF